MADFYNVTGVPAARSGPSGTSAAMRAEFVAIETAMAKLAGYTGNGSKFLRVNAGGTAYEAISVATALAALAPNSAALATALADTTGTGVFVRTQAPTLTSAVLVTPALGTPASGVATNLTGTAAGLTAGNVTTNANLTGHITSTGNAAVLGSFTSAQLATALTDETGTGANVFASSPNLTTPALGTPSALVGTNITGTAAGLSIGGNAATATTATNLSGGTFLVTKNGVNQGSILSGANNKVTFSTETFDTGNTFDTGTSRFTPTVAGKYLLVAALLSTSSSVAGQVWTCVVFKNGATAAQKYEIQSGVSTFMTSAVSVIVDANGTTDYFEVFVYQDSGVDQIVSGTPSVTYFSGCRV